MFIESITPSSQERSRSLGECGSATGETQVEVILREDETGETSVDLVEYSWGSGLGWCPRKRITLDLEQATALAAVLGEHFRKPEEPAPARPRPRVQEDGNVIQLLFG